MTPIPEHPAQVAADRQDAAIYTCSKGCPASWWEYGACPLCGADPKRRRPGRPLHSTDPTSRERRFRVVMTDTEHEALFAHARAEGVKVADLIRGIAPVNPGSP